MPAVSIIPSDSQSIFSVLNALKVTNPNRVQAIVRPNNPPTGVAGFIFDVVLDDAFDLKSDITDHYVEDNYAIQDQISLKPETFTVKGLVAELVVSTPTQQLQDAQVNPLPLFAPLAPIFTTASEESQAVTALDTVAATNSIVDTQSLYGYFNGSAGALAPTRQAKAFSYFYQLWSGRQLFSVETPWGVMTNMAIESISANQPAESASKTEFTITFKKIRFAQAVTVNIGQLAGRAQQQNAATTRQAKATVTTLTPERLRSWILQMFD